MSDLKMEDTGSSPCQECTLAHVKELTSTLAGLDVDFSSIPSTPPVLHRPFKEAHTHGHTWPSLMFINVSPGPWIVLGLLSLLSRIFYSRVPLAMVPRGDLPVPVYFPLIQVSVFLFNFLLPLLSSSRILVTWVGWGLLVLVPRGGSPVFCFFFPFLGLTYFVLIPFYPFYPPLVFL